MLNLYPQPVVSTSGIIINKLKQLYSMTIKEQLEQLEQLISELEIEMWYNVHADAPHRAHKNKLWVDQLKEQVNKLRAKSESQPA